jgi:predicted DsbA family dithiol-disulfide isomerase
MGLRGVPLFVIDGRPRIEGAQDAATIAAVLREALAAAPAPGLAHAR